MTPTPPPAPVPAAQTVALPSFLTGLVGWVRNLLVSFLGGSSGKRTLVMVLGSLYAILQGKVTWLPPVSDAQLQVFAAVLIGYLGQSGYNAATTNAATVAAKAQIDAATAAAAAGATQDIAAAMIAQLVKHVVASTPPAPAAAPA